MTFYTYWPVKKTLFHFCCNLFKVGYIFVIDCLDYVNATLYCYYTVTIFLLNRDFSMCSVNCSNRYGSTIAGPMLQKFENRQNASLGV